jgi:hypothetical protein
MDRAASGISLPGSIGTAAGLGRASSAASEGMAEGSELAALQQRHLEDQARVEAIRREMARVLA